MKIRQGLSGMLFLIGIFAFASSAAYANSLFGKVTEINEGDLFTIMNLNRPIKIRLSGIDAPEVGQPYADVAKQHLSDLILGKDVVVQYSGLTPNNYILGKVLLQDQDIGLQMIRDGVAWYDLTSTIRLSQADRETYAGVEQVARSEKRGIWQDPAPVAPWDFVRNQKVVPTVRRSSASDRRDLSTDNLMRAVNRSSTRKFGDDAYTSWKTLSPEDYNFSVTVPANAMEQGATIPTKSGKTADTNFAAGRYGQTVYLVSWSKGPLEDFSDARLMDDRLNGFVDVLNKRLAEQGSEEGVSIKRERELKIGLVKGTQYRLTSKGLTGILRVFLKKTTKESEVYVLEVINGTEEDPKVTEFFNSLKFQKSS